MLSQILNTLKDIANAIVSVEVNFLPSDQTGLDVEIQQAQYIYSYTHKAWFDASELELIATCEFLEAAVHIPSGRILLSCDCEWQDQWMPETPIAAGFPGFSKHHDYLNIASGAL